MPTSKDEVASHQDVNAGHCTALQDVNEDVNDVQDAAGRERERSGEPFPKAPSRGPGVQRAVRAGGAVFAQSARAVAALGDGRMAGTTS